MAQSISDIGGFRQRRRDWYLGFTDLSADERAVELGKDKSGVMWRDYMAEEGLRDPWYFMRYILGIPVLYEPLHGELCRFLEGPSRKKLILWARGHVKSNIITVGHTLLQMARNPDTRTLIGSHTEPDTRKFLSLIANQIYTGTGGRVSKFSKVYPEIRPALKRGKPARWNDQQLLIDRDTTFVDPSVDTASLDGPVTGSHYSVIKLDDLINEKNTANATLIAKAEVFHAQCQSLLDPGGEEYVIGTRYAYDDLYGHILDDEWRAPMYAKSIVPAIHDWNVLHELAGGGRKWEEADDYRHLAFPMRFTLAKDDIIDPSGDELKAKKSLIQAYRSQGSTTFANQYMLEPFDTGAAIFKEQDIRVIDRLPADGSGLRWFRFCDLSTVKHTGDSYTAILTVAVDHECNVYVTDIFWGDYDPNQIIDELFRGQAVADDKRPSRVVFEKAMFERVLQHFIRQRSIKDGIWIPSTFLDGAQGNKTKEQRILGLQSWFEAGRVHILKTCKNKHVLIEELMKFSVPMKFKRADCADALAQFPPVVFPGRAPERNPAEIAGEKVARLNNPCAIMAKDVWAMGRMSLDVDSIPMGRLARRIGA